MIVTAGKGGGGEELYRGHACDACERHHHRRVRLSAINCRIRVSTNNAEIEGRFISAPGCSNERAPSSPRPFFSLIAHSNERRRVRASLGLVDLVDTLKTLLRLAVDLFCSSSECCRETRSTGYSELNAACCRFTPHHDPNLGHNDVATGSRVPKS